MHGILHKSSSIYAVCSGLTGKTCVLAKKNILNTIFFVCIPYNMYTRGIIYNIMILIDYLSMLSIICHQ